MGVDARGQRGAGGRGRRRAPKTFDRRRWDYLHRVVSIVLLLTAYNNITFKYKYSVVLYKYNIIILCCTGKRNDRHYIRILCERMQNIL